MLLRGTVIQYRRCWFAWTVVKHISYDADDGIRLAIIILAGIVANLPSKRVYGSKELSSKRLVYHGNF